MTLQDIFMFRAEGADGDGGVRGRYLATGAVPRFYEAMKRRGVEIDVSIFREGT